MGLGKSIIFLVVFVAFGVGAGPASAADDLADELTQFSARKPVSVSQPASESSCSGMRFLAVGAFADSRSDSNPRTPQPVESWEMPEGSSQGPRESTDPVAAAKQRQDGLDADFDALIDAVTVTAKRFLGEDVTVKPLTGGGMNLLFAATSTQNPTKPPVILKVARPAVHSRKQDTIRLQEAELKKKLSEAIAAGLLKPEDAERFLFYDDVPRAAEGTSEPRVQHGPFFSDGSFDSYYTKNDRVIGGYAPYASSLHLMREMSEAVRVLHVLGRVHNDVKPANFLVDMSTGVPRLRLADWDTLALQNTPGMSPRDSITVAGTPAYLLWKSNVGETANDMYALSVSMQEVLLRRRPTFTALPDCPHDLNTMVPKILSSIAWVPHPDATSLARSMEAAEKYRDNPDTFYKEYFGPEVLRKVRAKTLVYLLDGDSELRTRLRSNQLGLTAAETQNLVAQLDALPARERLDLSGQPISEGTAEATGTILRPGVGGANPADAAPQSPLLSPRITPNAPHSPMVPPMRNSVPQSPVVAPMLPES